MTPGFLTFAATLGGFIAVIVGLKLILEPTNALRLGIFRPYRGHPWAQGVQEEDAVRFTWSRRRDAPASTIEDLTGETAAVRRVEDVSIHQPRR